MKTMEKTYRKDIVSGKKFPKNELIRISIQKNGITCIDKDYNLGGRGINILPINIKKGIEKNIISRNLKRFGGNINSIIIELEGVMNG